MENFTGKIRGAILAAGFLFSLPQMKYLGLPLAAWAFLPYLLYFALTARLKRNNGAVLGAGISILCIDFFSRINILFFPGSSTASIGLLFLPLFLIAIIFPAGLLLGWFIQYVVEFYKETKGR